MPSFVICTLLGSPPRRRGKEVADEGIGGIIRITPAWAGKRAMRTGTSARPEDHPRVGGEKTFAVWENVPGAGSPPRGRGKVPCVALLHDGKGITPAWAGKSSYMSERAIPSWDHPRVGGEKTRVFQQHFPAVGSPPRGRGKAFYVQPGRAAAGITPAWAGKRGCMMRLSAVSGDHPRVGGEKSASSWRWISKRGSPPRGRGKVLPSVVGALGNGITPAWAGKRHFCNPGLERYGDHPRVGGEKCTLSRRSAARVGSPPRGRGKGGKLPGRVRADGITPAWAGKRAGQCWGLCSARDHPRVGGEKTGCAMKVPPCQGSPPRGRGKAEQPFFLGVAYGITPAWAGKRLKRSHRSGIFISGPIPFYSVLHRPAGSGGSRAGRDGSPAGRPQNAGPA